MVWQIPPSVNESAALLECDTASGLGELIKLLLDYASFILLENINNLKNCEHKEVDVGYCLQKLEPGRSSAEAILSTCGHVHVWCLPGGPFE